MQKNYKNYDVMDVSKGEIQFKTPDGCGYVQFDDSELTNHIETYKLNHVEDYSRDQISGSHAVEDALGYLHDNYKEVAEDYYYMSLRNKIVNGKIKPEIEVWT